MDYYEYQKSKKLAGKMFRTIESCQTLSQLGIAGKYVDLALAKLPTLMRPAMRMLTQAEINMEREWLSYGHPN